MDSRDQASKGPPVFLPQRHPELRQLGRKAIHIFLRERERYLLRAKDAVAQGSVFKPVSLVSSVSFDLLTSLIRLDTFENVTGIAELTDEVLQKWLQSKIGDKMESIKPEDLEAMVKKSVQMKVNEPDPELRIMALFADYHTFLRDRRMENLPTENPKVAVGHIVLLLRPQVLKEKIEYDLSLHKKSLKGNFNEFYKYVLEKATVLEEFLVCSHSAFSMSTPSGQPGSSKTKYPRGKGYKSRSTSDNIWDSDPTSYRPKTRVHTAQTEAKGKQPVAGNATRKADGFVPFCLNRKTCPNQRHYIADCDKISPEQKKELFADYRRNKHQGGIMKRVRFVDEAAEADHALKRMALQDTQNGRIAAALADTVHVTVAGDYGADHAALCDDHLADLAAANIFVPILPLKEPVSMQLAVNDVDNPITVTAERKARVSTTLSTLEGPFRLRNVEYLVFKEHMSEVLLSRPLLQSLGFNLDAHLARVRTQYQDIDCSNIGFEPDHAMAATADEPEGKLSRLLNTEVSKKATYLDDSEEDEPVVPRLPSAHDIIQEQPTTSDSLLDVGRHDHADVMPHLERMHKEALENGLPTALGPRLRALLEQYKDVFCVKLGSDPPVKIPPMNIRLTAGAKPVRVKVRRYTQQQSEFLHNKVKDLEGLGLIRRNSQSSWACAPLILPKPGPEKFRFTVDLRPVNKVTLPHAWPMPDLETVLAKQANKKCFASIDFCHGYWQFPLAEDSQKCQSFITPGGVYTPTRVMHGQRNAVAYCQSSVQQICASLLDKLLLWLDDILVHEEHPEELLNSLEEFFQLCLEHDLKLHAPKCKLFLLKVRWCGRLISGKGVRLDPSRLQALLDMPFPRTGSELQQFICAANWMRAGIPQFTTIIAPLANLMEAIYRKVGHRTKRRVAKVQLIDMGWTTVHEDAFNKVQQALANAVSLSHPDPAKLFCLFTDASEDHWSGILTQIPPGDLDQPFHEQGHEPLAFLSGSFKGSSSRWSTPEKEAAAIIFSAERLDYLLMRPEGFHLFTDNGNLVFIFNPDTASLRLTKATISKIQRWSMILSNYQYTIVHISGEDNCWADLLTRWGAKQSQAGQEQQSEAKHWRLAALFTAQLAPDHDPDFTWPSPKDIMDSQKHVTTNERDKYGLIDHDGILKLPSGAIFVPPQDVHLQLRVCIVGHCGRGGHRSSDSTLSAIKDYCFWRTMNKDVANFCATCLHCISTTGGLRIPRPLGHALHADKPNELIHFDFLYMGKSTTGEEYVLIIKEDVSTYSWLQPAKDTDAQSAAEALLNWFAVFGVAQTWVSDRASHFKNKVISYINRALHAHHRFTTPNTPQANGTVERVCREVLRCCRALLSEFRMKEEEWIHVLPIIQSVLNHTKLSSLGDRAPITVFTGLPADNPLRLILPPAAAKPKSLDQVRMLREMHVEGLLQALEAMHKDVSERKTKQRAAAIQKHNQKTNICPANFEVGDYVLVAKRVAKDGHKLKLQWLGPQKVIRAVSDWVYECQDLVNERVSLVLANRLKFYSDSQLNVTQELLDTIEHNDVHYNVALKLLDLRFNRSKKVYEVQVKLKGFEHEDPTWESIQNIDEDIPDMLKKFLLNFPDKGKAQRAKNSLTSH